MPETPVDQIRVGIGGTEPAKSPILDQSLREQDERAGERNKYRTLAQKLFGQGKVSGIDMAMEEAMKMDSLIDQEVSKGSSMSDAVQAVSHLPEFQLKGLRLIKQEEFVRAKALQFGHALEENKFLKAKVLRELPLLEVDGQTQDMFKQAVSDVVHGRAKDLAVQKEGGNFVKLVHGFRGDMTQDGIKQIPQDALHAPEIQGPIQKELIASLNYHSVTVEDFGRDRDKYATLGIVSAAEINKLPEIQKLAKDRLVASLNYHSVAVEDFGVDRDKYVSLGIVSAAEINAFPEIQAIAKGRLVESFRYHSVDFAAFGDYRDKFVKLGIVDATTANKLPEIQKIAKERLIGSLRYHSVAVEDFGKDRDAIAKLGVVSAAEINRLPEIQQLARERILQSLQYHTVDLEAFNADRMKYVNLGVVDLKTINSWPEVQKLARERIIASKRYHTFDIDAFNRDRDTFVRFGIFDMPTINSWPEMT
jgi:hypothetical protein